MYAIVNIFYHHLTVALVFQETQLNYKKKIAFFADAHKVHCSEDWMKVDIVLPSIPGTLVYLEGMKGYPNPKCQPESTTELAQFKLSLKDFYDCGVTRAVNKITVSIWLVLGLKGSI